MRLAELHLQNRVYFLGSPHQQRQKDRKRKTQHPDPGWHTKFEPTTVVHQLIHHRLSDARLNPIRHTYAQKWDQMHFYILGGLLLVRLLRQRPQA